jgi:hypothetical protein
MSFFHLVAIDPLALLLPSAIYQKIIEGIHPHVPKVAEIQQAARSMTPEERQFTLTRARSLAAYAKVVEEAIAGMK